MKKALAYFFALLMILLVSSIFLVSCKTKQLQPDMHTEIVKQKDSSSHTQTTDNNKAIIDSLILAIGKIQTAKPECDSVAQLAVENFIKTLNTSKKSGDNSYEIKYNELLKRLEIVMKIGATKNIKKQDYLIKEISSDRFITKTITVKAPLAKWQLYLMIIGAGTIIFIIFKAVLFVRKMIPV
jgi:hypothetical protein